MRKINAEIVVRFEPASHFGILIRVVYLTICSRIFVQIYNVVSPPPPTIRNNFRITPLPPITSENIQHKNLRKIIKRLTKKKKNDAAIVRSI